MRRTALTSTASFVLLAMVAGCSPDGGCDDYRRALGRSDVRAELVRWADEQIFARTFDSEDFDPVGFVGPGKGGANLALARAGIQLPTMLMGYTVRSVGPDRYRPDVIFLGKRRYQGILITRGELDEALTRTTIDRRRVEQPNGRVAMMCYTEV